MKDRINILTRWLAPAACLLIGFVFGWRGIPDKQPLDAELTQVCTRPVLQHRIPDATSRKAARHIERAQHLKDSEFREYLAAIPRKEADIMFSKILSQAGAGGIGKKNAEILRELVKNWVGKSPEEAFGWAMAIESESTRRPLVDWVLREISCKDPKLAWEKYQTVRTVDPSMFVPIPPALMNHSLEQGADAFLKLVLISSTTEKPICSGMEFPANFDFQKAADGVIAWKQQQQGKNPSDFPMNFMETWAARDPRQAAQFLADHGTGALPLAGWRQVIRASAKSIGEENTFKWFHDILINDPESQALGGLVEAVWLGEERFARVFPDENTRDQVILRNLHAAGWLFRESLHGPLISSLSTPEARLQALRSLNFTSDNARKLGEHQLKKWGMSREQLLSEVGKEDGESDR